MDAMKNMNEMKTYRARVCFPEWIVKYFEETDAETLLLKDSWMVTKAMVRLHGTLQETDAHEAQFFALQVSPNSSPSTFKLEWLTDIEEIKPVVDWSKVKVDARLTENDGVRSHFSRYENLRVLAFNGGSTSWTANSVHEARGPKLAEDES